MDKAKGLVRPAIARSYFNEKSYYGERDTALWPEKWLAGFTDERVIARGEKGNLFFVDLRKIKKGFRFDGGNLQSIAERLPEKISDKIQSLQRA